MKPVAVTVGIPVRDLDVAVAWYRHAFGLGEPDLRPMDRLAEFDLGSFWLQLAVSPDHAGGEGISLNISVESAAAEQKRFAGLGLDVTEVERFEGAVEFFQLSDPDGNTIGFVTELE